jgi:glycosyltransferase involved in cell wall biosynthesis
MSVEREALRKILIIAHEFPPICGGNVMRMAKFAKYLPEYGWHPVVLTAKPDDCYHSYTWVYDPSLLAEIQGRATVHQIPSPLERRARRLMQRVKGTDPNRSVARPRNGAVGRTKQNQLLQALRRLRVYQDQKGLWVPYAYRAALSLVGREKIDVILTTSPPHAIHLVGYWLKRRTGLPWVADFRDGWTDNPLFSAESKIRQRFERWMERNVIHSADAKLVVTRHMLASFRRDYPAHGSSFHLLRNGFDPADFVTPSAKATSGVSFAHVGNAGSFYRDPVPLLRAFQQLFAEERLPAGEVKVQFVGRLALDGPDVLPLLEGVDVIPPVGHREAIQKMVNSDVLLLIAGMKEGEAAFTSKVFEYLAARRPILAVIPLVGELAQLLASYSKGIVVSPDNIEQIKEGVVRAYKMTVNDAGLVQSDHDLINQFDRRLQTGQLVDLLEVVS